MDSNNMTALLRPCLLGPTPRYIVMARYGAVIDTSWHYDKRDKATHRFTIADTRGRLDITIPVAKPGNWHTATVADILLSGHLPWWQTAMTALESAYGRTPYFEFYADDFAALLTAERVGTPLVALQADLDNLVCRLIGIDAPHYETAAQATQPTTADYRRNEPQYDIKPYWQVREHELGFIGSLSIVDLLFNHGPESLLYLLGR